MKGEINNELSNVVGETPLNASMPKPTRLSRVGAWLQSHGVLIRRLQWVVVALYLFLIIVPTFLPLPDHTAYIWNNLTVFAQFIFWGLWWPFVLLSMILMGRTWCGVICPEGTLTEFASRYGRGKTIPHWIRWRGWPFIAFVLTTIYGQMISVYQYPKAVLIILGGSTVAAIVIGLMYGKEKRVWCKYLCPVNGVFALLARLAPFHFKVNEEAWRRSYTEGEHGHRVIPINCAPLVPLRKMKGGADCHMCGRCNGHRDAIELSWRSPSEEVVKFGDKQGNIWETILILFGLCGIAIGGFHWTVSPWFIAIKQSLAVWLIDKNIMWPFETNVPWFLLTHYPDQNDIFSWLDGALVIFYMLATALIYGTGLLFLLIAATKSLGTSINRIHHLAQALIPIAGCGVFLGLSATTLTILKGQHIFFFWANDVRLLLIIGANMWSFWLAWKVIKRYSENLIRQLFALSLFSIALIWISSAWWLMFWYW